MHTLTQHILTAKHREPVSPKGFALLMNTIENASRIISAHVRKIGISDLLGVSGGENVSGDQVKRIDVYAHELLSQMLSDCAQVSQVGSEEAEDILTTSYPDAPYRVFFDPLDGSSNIDSGGSLGTIFSIYHTSNRHESTSNTSHPDESRDPKVKPHAALSLPRGIDQIAAGYILYGSTTIFVYATAEGVHGFTLDPSTGCYLLSHPDIHFPTTPTVYVANEANSIYWDEQTTQMVADLKASGAYKQRNAGCLVADFHNILINGGVFLYPADKKNKSGKLRLMYEVCPMSYIAVKAGGKALSGDLDPLMVQSSDLHQKVGWVAGVLESTNCCVK